MKDFFKNIASGLPTTFLGLAGLGMLGYSVYKDPAKLLMPDERNHIIAEATVSVALMGSKVKHSADPVVPTQPKE